MSTWQIIMALLHSANFYWRKFFVFLIIAIIIGSGYFIWKNQSQTQAAVLLGETPNSGYIDQINLDIEVAENGQVLIDGRNFTRDLKILPDYYEIKILAIDNASASVSNFTATMHLPQAVQEDQIEQIMYAVHGVGSYQSYMQDAKTLIYRAANISPQATVTIVAHLPKDILQPPFSKRLVYGLTQIPVKSYLAISILLPFLTFILLIFMVVKRRQDQIFYLSKKITIQPPTDTPPAIIGVLIDGQAGAREIAATLIDLARRGYLFITYHADGHFTFGKRKSLNVENLPELNDFERVLLSKIFELGKYKSTREDVEMRVGRHIFSRKIAQVYLQIYNEATRLGFFVKNPAVVHLRWRYAGVALFFSGLLGFILAAIFSPDPKFTLFFWAGEMGAASVMIWLSGLMPVRSVTGTITLRKWLEFRQYLKLNRPIEAGANLMDKFCHLLPYAVVFGLEAEWARRFLAERFTKPDWYESEDTVVTLEKFVDGLYPIIDYVGGSLAKSHEPTVE